MKKVLVVGDAFVSPDNLEKAAKDIYFNEELEIIKLNWEDRNKEIFTKRAQNIEKNGPEAEEIPNIIYEQIEDADALLIHFCPVSKKLINRAKKLKLIGTCRGGMEHIDVKCASDKNIPVVHCIRNAEPVADFALGLIISETRNIARSHKFIMEGKWVKDFANQQFTTTLSEQKVGIVGLGYIGRLVAKKLQALGIQVMGYDPFVSSEKLREEGLEVQKREIEDIFKECDIISLHLRLSESTKNLINKKYISLMKPNAYLINTSRAGVLEESAVYEALKDKKIAGAALDVLWEEPLPKNSPFLELDNITLTPHIAGDTVDAIPNSPKLLVKEINKYLKTGKNDMVVNLNKII